MASTYIFVYGSLRKGFSSPARGVLDNDAEFLSKATFQGKLFMIEWYPGVVPSDDETDIVHGEVYKMINPGKVLRKLDQYEGCSPSDPKPHAFIRKEMPVMVKDEKITAWVYLFNQSVSGKEGILSGDFIKKKI